MEDVHIGRQLYLTNFALSGAKENEVHFDAEENFVREKFLKKEKSAIYQSLICWTGEFFF